MVRRRTGPSAEPVEAALVDRVRQRAREWFPELVFGGEPGAEPRVELRVVSDRPRSRLYAVSLDPGSSSAQVLVKVRQVDGDPVEGAADRRPTLATGRADAAEMTRREHDALVAIARSVDGDPRFAVVRPLDVLPEHRAIFMDFVAAPTLRQVLARESRLVRPLRARADGDGGETWRRAGAWLAAFQRWQPTGLPARQRDRDDVVGRFRAYQEHLTREVGRSGAADLAARGAELAGAALPASLPLAVGHGDYAPRNVFLHADGRIAVFDPLARWRVPVYEDVCRFSIGVRLLGLRLHTHGLAFAPGRVHEVAEQVLQGYLVEAGVLERELRCYELLVLLDKWSALLSGGGSWPARARSGSVRLASRFVRQEAERALARAAAAA